MHPGHLHREQQPGFISTQPHQGIGGSSVIVNVAVWDSVEAFRNAFGKPEFQAALGAYPPSTIASPQPVHEARGPRDLRGLTSARVEPSALRTST